MLRITKLFVLLSITLLAVFVLQGSYITAQNVAVDQDGEEDVYDEDYDEVYASDAADAYQNSQYTNQKASNNNNKNSNNNQKASSSLFEPMFGETLYMWGKDEDAKGSPAVYEAGTAELLKKANVVAVYFSASWCPPCRQFTPALVKLYNAVNKKRPGSLEVVWVSGDRSQEEFLGYYQKMPWLAVTLQNIQAATQKLSPRFGVKGIPHLVLLDGKDGSVISMDAKRQVSEDPHGLQFPWRPRSTQLLRLLVPAALRSLVTEKIQQWKTQLLQMLRDLLQKLSPMYWLSAGKSQNKNNNKQRLNQQRQR